MESKQQIDNEIKLGWSKPTKFKNKKLNILVSKLVKIQEDRPFKNRDRNLQDKKRIYLLKNKHKNANTIQQKG